jgi:hypothetical protein
MQRKLSIENASRATKIDGSLSIIVALDPSVFFFRNPTGDREREGKGNSDISSFRVINFDHKSYIQAVHLIKYVRQNPSLLGLKPNKNLSNQYLPFIVVLVFSSLVMMRFFRKISPDLDMSKADNSH